jgi:guanosine-3',5'-bis(diphosphate) 3'-pyrophosphohydrolase
MTPSPIITARHFAREVHKDITIKTISGDIRPQFEHLQEVADLVWASGGSETEIAATWLHDMVEDTPVTLKEIEEKFGKEVADIVDGLTDPVDFKNYKNAERKQMQADRIKDKSDSVKRIKVADQISNIRLVTTDPKLSWGREGNRDYVIGAKKIAEQCRGISSILDNLFDSEYKKSAEYFNIK